MGGPDDAEVAVVEGGDLGGAEAFGDGDEAGVGAAEGEVGVAVDELGDSGPVVGVRASTVISPEATPR